MVKKQKSLIFKIIGLLFLLLLSFLSNGAVLAADDDTNALTKLDNIARDLGLTQKNLPATIGGIINIVLSFLGIIFFVLIVYAGIVWMTSGGNEQKIAQAKETIVSATIGLAIVMISYGLSVFIMTKLENVGIIT